MVKKDFYLVAEQKAYEIINDVNKILPVPTITKKQETALEWAKLWNTMTNINNRDSIGKKKCYLGKKYAGYQ